MAGFHHIHLELAREPGAPSGDRGLGYDLVAPLDAEGRLDGARWKADPARSRVRRFRDGHTEAVGGLSHVSGGRWVFDFGEHDRDDERGVRLEDERFSSGEYVSVRMTDGRVHTFKVTSVRPVEPA